MSYLYGLEHSNKDFETEEAFGKNTFTTAFPVALANYIDREKNLPMNYIVALLDNDNIPTTHQTLTKLESLIGIAPEKAYYAFEDSYAGYDKYATTQANRSDLVVKDNDTGKEVSAFEVKLVVVPTSGTANKRREQQLCELVVRPPSIEQLCFSVAASYGIDKQIQIRDIIVDALGNPIDYDWNNKAFMIRHRENILAAADELIRQGIDKQSPFALMGEWRTQGQDSSFDLRCFDVFFWSNFAFLQLFTQGMRDSESRDISRPERSVIWFIKSMFDYTAQGSITFERTHSQITFDGQTDKAGAFTNNSIAPFVLSDNFIFPRVTADERAGIITDQGVAFLKPERRLDAMLLYVTLQDMLKSS